MPTGPLRGEKETIGKSPITARQVRHGKRQGATLGGGKYNTQSTRMRWGEGKRRGSGNLGAMTRERTGSEKADMWKQRVGQALLERGNPKNGRKRKRREQISWFRREWNGIGICKTGTRTRSREFPRKSIIRAQDIGKKFHK